MLPIQQHIDWSTVEGFKATEPWGDPDRMDPALIRELVLFRKFLGRSVVIHCGTQGNHVEGSAHYRGLAVDLHVPGMSALDAFFAAARFGFHGIGVYPDWHNPGIHVDRRDLATGEPRAFWMQRRGVYIALNAANLNIKGA
jgi:hypothetical protein